jgi:hypothetical protein
MGTTAPHQCGQLRDPRAIGFAAWDMPTEIYNTAGDTGNIKNILREQGSVRAGAGSTNWWCYRSPDEEHGTAAHEHSTHGQHIWRQMELGRVSTVEPQQVHHKGGQGGPQHHETGS